MADTTRAEYLSALLSQKKQNAQQGNSIVNQGDAVSSSSDTSDDTSFWSKLVGGADELLTQVKSGVVSAFEGIADLAATGIGALGDATGWYDSKPFTDWASIDLSSRAANWERTYGWNMTNLINNAKTGNYLNGDYWKDMGTGLLNMVSLGTYESDHDYDVDFDKYYGYATDQLASSETGQFVNGIAYSIGNMLPSIVLGQAVGGAASSAGLGKSAVENLSKAASVGFEATGAGGKSAVEALEDGASAGQAFGYGLAGGIIEGGTEYIPWEKIPGLGKILGENTVAGLGLRSFSISSLAKSMAQEGLEEVVGDMANPIAQMIYKGTDSLSQYSDPSFYKDVFLSFASGAITGGLMEGANMADNTSRYSKQGVNYINDATQWAEDYMNVVKEYDKLDSDYSKSAVGDDTYQERYEDIAKKLKELDERGSRISDEFNEIPDKNKGNVRALFDSSLKTDSFRNKAEEGRNVQNSSSMQGNETSSQGAYDYSVSDTANNANNANASNANSVNNANNANSTANDENSAKVFEPYDGTTTIENDANLSDDEKTKYSEVKRKANGILSELNDNPLPYEPDENKPEQYLMVAPLYKIDLANDETSYNSEMMEKFREQCERIAKISGCTYEDAENAIGVYENNSSRMVNEPSISSYLGKISQENADLAGSLMADLANQQQESVIIYNEVNANEFESVPFENKAILFKIKLAGAENAYDLAAEMRKSNFQATALSNEIIQIQPLQFMELSEDSGSEAINRKINEYASQLAEKCATLKSEGKLNEQSEITVKYINERYLDRDSRRDVYEIRNQVRESGGVEERLGEDIQRGQGEKTEGKGGKISQSSNVNASEKTSLSDSKTIDFDEQERKARLQRSSEQLNEEINERKAQKTLEERKAAYDKAQKYFDSNQQLQKDASPSQTISLKDAKNYAKAENDLVTSYLNYRTGSSGEFSYEASEELSRKYAAAIDAGSKEGAIGALDDIFSDAIEKGSVRISGKSYSIPDFLSESEMSDLKEYAHSMHEALLDTKAKESKITKFKTGLEARLSNALTKLSNTVEYAKEVDRFNKNAELTKRRYKIDQNVYKSEIEANGTLSALAKSLPRYNISLKDGRMSDNNGLSLSKKSYVKWASEAKSTVQKFIDGGYFVNAGQTDIMSLFDNVIDGGDANSKSLSVEQIRSLTSIMKQLRYQLSNAAMDERVKVKTTATNMNTEISYRFEAMPKSVNKALSLGNTALLDQIKMMSYGDVMMGYDNSSLQKAMDSIMDWRARFYDDYYEIKEKYLDTSDMKKLAKEFKGKIELEGKKVSKAEAFEAYMQLSDPETRTLMDYDNEKATRKIRFSDGTQISYGPETYSKLEAAIGKDLAERGKSALLSYYNDHSEGSYLNRLRDFQIRKTGDTNVADNRLDYYPRSLSKDSVAKINNLESLEKSNAGITKANGNVTQTRQTSQQVVVLQAADAFAKADGYAAQVANEMNLKYPTNEFLRMLGLNVEGTDGKTTRLQMTLGPEYTNLLRDFITSANGIELVRSDGLISYIQGGTVSATLGMSPINPAKNFLSVFKEGHEAGFSNVAKYLFNPAKWKNSALYKAVQESGTWKARYADNAFSMQSNFDTPKNAWSNLMQKTTFLYSAFDKATSLMVAGIDYEYIKKANPGISESDAIAKTVEMWQKDVNLTQSTAEKAAKSQSSSGRFMGNDSQIVKAAWTFQSDTVAGASMLIKDAYQLQASGKIIKWANSVLSSESADSMKAQYAKAMLEKATSTRNAIIKKRLPAGIMATLVGAVLKYLIEDLNSRVKGNKGWGESVIDGDTLTEMTKNTIGSVVPFAETIFSAMDYNSGKVSLFAFEGLANVLSAISEFKEGNYRTATVDTVTSLAAMAGLPVKNIYNYTIGFVSGFKPDVAVEMKNVLYADERSSTSYSDNFNTALYERVGDVSDDAKIELKTLYEAGYDSKPSGVYETYTDSKGDEVTISWSDKQSMKRYYQRANAKLTKMIKETSYKQLTDEEKAKAIKRLYSAYRDASLVKTVTKETPTSVATALAYANYSDLGTMLTAVTHISTLEATKTSTKKERAVAYVNSLKLTKAQRMVVLKMAGYTVDASHLKTILRQAGYSTSDIKKIAGE